MLKTRLGGPHKEKKARPSYILRAIQDALNCRENINENATYQPRDVVFTAYL